MPKQLLIIGNWKMHGRNFSNQQFAKTWQATKATEQITVSVACPHVYLESCAHLFAKTPIKVSAQNVSDFEQDGAYTGETSAQMLKDIGVHYVLIGHSERRHYFGENNTVLANKFFAAQKAGITPILCIGEQQVDRDAGQTQWILEKQLSILCDQNCDGQKIVIAYEPIWAIGTGCAATSEQITANAELIRNFILRKIQGTASIQILYGGSVTASNIAVILSAKSVDGVLVGSASLDPNELLQIYSIAERLVASWK